MVDNNSGCPHLRVAQGGEGDQEAMDCAGAARGCVQAGNLDCVLAES